MQGCIVRTLLQVEDERSDIIRNFLGYHVRIITYDGCRCGGSGNRNSEETV